MRLVTVHRVEATRNFTGKQPHAVVFGINGHWVTLSECIDCSAPTAAVPPHSIVITPKSPAWKGSGFIGQKVAIGIRDMFAALRISDYVQSMRQAGVLDTEKDEHLDRELTRLLTLYGREVARF